MFSRLNIYEIQKSKPLCSRALLVETFTRFNYDDYDSAKNALVGGRNFTSEKIPKQVKVIFLRKRMNFECPSRAITTPDDETYDD